MTTTAADVVPIEETVRRIDIGPFDAPLLGDRDDVILVAGRWVDNAVMMAEVARLWFPHPSERPDVLDATYGEGNFWTLGMLAAYAPTTNDAAPRDDIPVDHTYDFRSLPEAWADRFDLTIWDPFYQTKGTRTGHSFEKMNAAYGLINAPKNAAELEVYNHAGLAEIVRVTKPGGRVFVKYADGVESGAKVPQLYRLTRHAVETLGLELIDRFIFVRERATSQPPRSRKGPPGEPRIPSQQCHAAQNTSELLVFEVPCREDGGMAGQLTIGDALDG